MPRDFHHTHLFQQIDKKKSTGFDIQTLGRSGHEARIGYALSAMEMSGSSKRWTLRQTVIYHSLDLGTGRSFWLTTKANNEVSKRVMEAGSGVYGTNHTIPSTPQASLSNALQTHLITADWCCEGWRWHISSLELEVRNIFDKITAAPIPAEDTTLDPLPRLVMGISMKTSDTFTSQQISQPSSPVQSARTRLTSGTGSFGKGFQAFPQKTDPSSNGFTIPMQRFASRNGPDRSSEEQVEHTVKRLDVLRQFSLKEMQQLSFVSSKLREARMVMGLNIAILKELKEYYISLFETPDLPREIKEGCAVDMHEFKRRISALERFIESECLRCDTLMGQMNDGKTMVSFLGPLMEYRDGRLTQVSVRSHSRGTKQRDRKAICHELPLLNGAHGNSIETDGARHKQYARHRSGHRAGHCINAHHHIFHPYFPTGNIPRCKTIFLFE